MNAVNGDGLSREYLIRQVAKRLSPELRAEYYDTLRHCRSLPANDELLVILNAIHLLPLLTVDLPGQITSEREKLERLLISSGQVQENSARALAEYQAQLDERLASLPQEISKLLTAEAIATLITESLRQQFEQTAIPETAKLVRSGADDINGAVAELRGGARTIGRVLNEAVLEGNGFLTRVQAACLDGTESVSRAAQRMAKIVNASIGGLMLLSCGVGIAVGLMLGIFLHDWWAVPGRPVQPAMAQPQSLTAAPLSGAREKTSVHRK